MLLSWKRGVFSTLPRRPFQKSVKEKKSWPGHILTMKLVWRIHPLIWPCFCAPPCYPPFWMLSSVSSCISWFNTRVSIKKKYSAAIVLDKTTPLTLFGSMWPPTTPHILCRLESHNFLLSLFCHLNHFAPRKENVSSQMRYPQSHK